MSRYSARLILHWMGSDYGFEEIDLTILSDESFLELYGVLDDFKWEFEAAGTELANDSRLTLKPGDFVTILFSGPLRFWSGHDHEGTPDGGLDIEVDQHSVRLCNLTDRRVIYDHYGLSGNPEEVGDE